MVPLELGLVEVIRMVVELAKSDERYLSHSPELRNFLAKHVNNPSTVDELVQDVFLKIFKGAKRNSVEKPRAYLFAVARNLLVDQCSAPARCHARIR